MSDSKHIMIAIGLFLAVLALGGAGLVLPNAREVRTVTARADDLRQRAEGVEETAALVEELSRMLVEARQAIDAEVKIIPRRADVATTIRKLSLPIDNVTVLDQTFNAGTTIEPLPNTNPSVRAVPITMEMRSTFDAIFAVLRTVEAMEHLVRVRSIRIRIVPDLFNTFDEPIVETVLILEAVFDEAAPDMTRLMGTGSSRAEAASQEGQ